MIILIAACDSKMGIGKDGGIPWACKEDMRLFKQITTGHKVVMGRKTWDSLSGPLPNRTNIVISRNKDLYIDGAIVSNDLVWPGNSHDALFVIGGREIYNMYMPYADSLYLTQIDGDFNCDTFMPLGGHQWVSSMPFITLSNNAKFSIYERNDLR